MRALFGCEHFAHATLLLSEYRSLRISLALVSDAYQRLSPLDQRYLLAVMNLRYGQWAGWFHVHDRGEEHGLVWAAYPGCATPDKAILDCCPASTRS